ncbi:MAG: histidinol-phosphate transaminase [Caldilineales bacterium]|nr:histidinol-phosphate transaminase [Caldilineales bacterium]
MTPTPQSPINPSPISSLLRPDIAAMEAYTPVKPFEVLSRELGRAPHEIIKLDANENPYGPSPRVLDALSRFPWYHIYPDPQQGELRQALAGYTGLPAEHILPGHGADELLDYLCRLFLAPGDSILNCPPTFGMYSFDAKLSGARVIEVWRDDHFRLDVAGIERAVKEHRPKLLFLTSPNNPDGSLIPHDALRRLLRLPLIVVVDEAYIEFAEDPAANSVASWVPHTPNLIVLRTFSKWAGLAGLRLGYGIFPLQILAHLWTFKQPYNVNVAATVAGLASLNDLPFLQTRIAVLKAERDRLYSALGQIPWLHPYPSQANFVLCRVEGRAAAELHRQLAAQGILVRYYDKPGLQNCIRISAGRPEDTERLLQTLTEYKEAA